LEKVEQLIKGVKVFKYVKFKELPVADQDRAIKFYTEQVGLRVAQDRPYQEGLRWIELEIPGAQTKILFSPRPDEEPTDMPGLALITDDIKASYEELRAKGVVFTQKPTVAAWNPQEMFALFRDSEGNTVLISTAENVTA
jgi:predicted enzyme related to lactoylglutathione lyase